MTTIVSKPDRRKGLRAMPDISKETFDKMTPENQKSVMFEFQKEQSGILDRLFKVLNGNGDIGLVTQTALNKQSLKRAWYFIGAIVLGLLSAGGLKAFYS